MVALKIAAVFAMGTAVGILYRIPRTLLLYGSCNGLLAWLVMYFCLHFGSDMIFANFFGSLAAGLMAELLARVLRKPATIFMIPGFMPLVPGRHAYNTMLAMVEGRYIEGMALAVQTFLTGGAIAFGIFTSTTMYRLLLTGWIGRIRNVGKS